MNRRYLLRAVQPIECNAGRASPGAEFTAIARDAVFWIRHAEAVLVDPAELRDLLRDLGLQSWLAEAGRRRIAPSRELVDARVGKPAGPSCPPLCG